ncbi:unnamed protein product, partial [Amoebophrya sp. A25]
SSFRFWIRTHQRHWGKDIHGSQKWVSPDGSRNFAWCAMREALALKSLCERFHRIIFTDLQQLYDSCEPKFWPSVGHGRSRCSADQLWNRLWQEAQFGDEEFLGNAGILLDKGADRRSRTDVKINQAHYTSFAALDEPEDTTPERTTSTTSPNYSAGTSSVAGGVLLENGGNSTTQTESEDEDEEKFDNGRYDLFGKDEWYFLWEHKHFPK